jgi:hypothetical protein
MNVYVYIYSRLRRLIAWVCEEVESILAWVREEVESILNLHVSAGR